MVKYIISNTLKFLVVTITGSKWFIYDRTYEEYYKHIDQTILYGDAMNMYLVIMEGGYGAIDADDS